MKEVTGRLAGILLGQPLDAWVRYRRECGHSWARISRELYAATEIEMSVETLRTHYPDPKRASA